MQTLNIEKTISAQPDVNASLVILDNSLPITSHNAENDHPDTSSDEDTDPISPTPPLAPRLLSQPPHLHPGHPLSFIPINFSKSVIVKAATLSTHSASFPLTCLYYLLPANFSLPFTPPYSQSTNPSCHQGSQQKKIIKSLTG